MLEVRGLPIKITKSDLDELFKDYGVVQSWESNLIQDQNVVFVYLDKNEELAKNKLDRTQWHGQYFLHLDFDRGGRGPKNCQPTSGDSKNCQPTSGDSKNCQPESMGSKSGH